MDRAGRPVAGLTKDDFSVVDDGTPQDVIHFWEHTLSDAEPEDKILRPGPSGQKLAPPSRRVFLIELDRPNPGRVHPPLFEALRTFLQKSLLRQDYAAIAAFGRVTDFTTDHAVLAEVVTRLETLTLKVLTPSRRGLMRDLWASHPPVGSEADRRLQEIFSPASTGQQLALRSQAGFEPLVRAAEQNARMAVQLNPLPETLQNLGTMAALENGAQLIKVIGDIQMLRYLEGEKHLIYAAQSAIGKKEAESLSELASDARISVYGIQAHGFPGGGTGFGMDYLLEGMAAATGGVSFSTVWPKDALAKIDAMTRTGYLLGYIPTSAVDQGGKPHNVVVRVRGRSDLTVHARRRYFAESVNVERDISNVLMRQRILSTGEYPREVTDIQVKAQVLAKSGSVEVSVSIDANDLDLKEDGGRYEGKLEIATFSKDGRDRLIGEDWRTLALKLQTETMAKARTEGLSQKVELKVSGEPKYVKVVVYDYNSGRAGSAILKLR